MSPARHEDFLEHPPTRVNRAVEKEADCESQENSLTVVRRSRDTFSSVVLAKLVALS